MPKKKVSFYFVPEGCVMALFSVVVVWLALGLVPGFLGTCPASLPTTAAQLKLVAPSCFADMSYTKLAKVKRDRPLFLSCYSFAFSFSFFFFSFFFFL
jgi:hypothetical protein